MAAGIRGKKVHATLFGDEEVEELQERLRGRNPELDAAKKEHILHRYLYYERKRMYSYPWMLNELKNEFYLTESTIGQLIEDSGSVLARIKRENLSVADLAQKYRYSKWGESTVV